MWLQLVASYSALTVKGQESTELMHGKWIIFLKKLILEIIEMQNNVIKVSSKHGKMEEYFLEQQRYLLCP